MLGTLTELKLRESGVFMVAIIVEQFLEATLPLFPGEEGEVSLHKCCVAVLSLSEFRGSF